MIDGMGPVTVNRLIGVFGTAGNVFEAPPSELNEVHGVHSSVVKQIIARKTLAPAEKEQIFAEQNQIRVLLISDPDYPYRLKQCPDAPAILYIKGNFEWNQPRILSIVGTRNATAEGKEICRNLIEELSREDILIV